MLKKYSPYTLCLLISILVVALYVNDFGPLLRLEWKIQDLMYTFRGDPNFSSDIVVVSIDDTSLAQYGSWPWPRDLVGDLVAAVGQDISKVPETTFPTLAKPAQDVVKPRLLFRFLSSPKAIKIDSSGHICGLTITENILVPRNGGTAADRKSVV